MDSSSVNAAASSAEKEYLFTAMPVNRAVISLAVPTVISQIITVVYNMADTFFIGQRLFETGKPRGCFRRYSEHFARPVIYLCF